MRAGPVYEPAAFLGSEGRDALFLNLCLTVSFRSCPSAPPLHPINNHVGAFVAPGGSALPPSTRPARNPAVIAARRAGCAREGEKKEAKAVNRRRRAATATPRDAQPSTRFPSGREARRMGVHRAPANEKPRAFTWLASASLFALCSIGPPLALSRSPPSPPPLHTLGRQDRQPDARHPGRQAGPQHLRRRVG